MSRTRSTATAQDRPKSNSSSRSPPRPGRLDGVGDGCRGGIGRRGRRGRDGGTQRPNALGRVSAWSALPNLACPTGAPRAPNWLTVQLAPLGPAIPHTATDVWGDLGQGATDGTRPSALPRWLPGPAAVRSARTARHAPLRRPRIGGHHRRGGNRRPDPRGVGAAGRVPRGRTGPVAERRAVGELLEELRQQRRLLLAIGCNLNQLVTVANAIGEISARPAEAVLRMVRDVLHTSDSVQVQLRTQLHGRRR